MQEACWKVSIERKSETFICEKESRKY